VSSTFLTLEQLLLVNKHLRSAVHRINHQLLRASPNSTATMHSTALPSVPTRGTSIRTRHPTTKPAAENWVNRTKRSSRQQDASTMSSGHRHAHRHLHPSYQKLSLCRSEGHQPRKHCSKKMSITVKMRGSFLLLLTEQQSPSPEPWVVWEIDSWAAL